MKPKSLLFIVLALFYHLLLSGQIITTFAGNGTYGYSGNGGPATSAQLAWPIGVATDNAGNVYIADHDNNVIRKVNSTGIITTIAGTGALGYSGDGGLAITAKLYHPSRVVVDNTGNLYFIDQNAEVIRKISTAGIITSITGNLGAGYSGDGGQLILAKFGSITGISFDNAGNMYISDASNHVIRKVNPAGIINTIAGTGIGGFSGDGGPALMAKLGSPFEVIFRSNGDMFIPDAGNNRIRVVNPAGIISTHAGTGIPGYSGDGGPATAAQMSSPWHNAIDGVGNIYISDASNVVVRKIDNAGIITTFAGNGTSGYSGDGGPATAAQMMDVCGVACDNAGNVYIVNRTQPNVVRKVTNCLTAVVTQQPLSVTLCNTGNTSFSITSTNVISFQWQVNTGNGWSNLTDNTIYSGSNTNLLSLTGVSAGMNNYSYRCSVTNSCGTIFSTAALLTVATPANPSITISSPTNNICAGASVTFLATSLNAGALPVYQWKKNGLPVGPNANAYTDNGLNNGDIITCDLTTNASCVITNTATSNTITVTVTANVQPSVTIAASTNNICFGTPVTFTSSVTNGGPTQDYTWFKNNVNLFLNSPTYTDNTLNNGDLIMCAFRSSLLCITSQVVPSLPLTINVSPLVTPTVNITASANPVCKNSTIVFNASAVNGGTSPVYQWRKNGLPVGGNSIVYTDNNFINGDIISCILTSSSNCITTSQVSSNAIPVMLHPDPVVTLDKNPSLCDGSTKTLDAGSFTSYLWSTGSVNRTITVNNTGTYSVIVTDNNGCNGSDVTVINNLLPLPSGFLPVDTSVCSYGSVLVKAISGYKNYLWSTGSVSSSVSITQPGQYWLQATDNNNCTGKEFITISPKECLKGLFVPSAFTPNNDGKNDLLKPFLLGNVKQYKFQIFNRWGQLVFETSDLTKGWNGNFAGHPQPNHVFVWVCQYQLEGEQVKTEKGTLVIVR